MSIFAINEIGALGIIKDRLPHTLPPNAWNDGGNVRFRDSYVEKTDGFQAVFGIPTVTPYALLPVQTENKFNWIYAGLSKVYVFDGTSHTNITRQTAGVDVNYSGLESNRWTLTNMGGVPILNNGSDVPQMWLPATTATKLVALLNWPGNTICEVMRSYRSFLIALNVSKSGVRYPQMVKWSHPADPFNVPTSWSETDPTKDAGEYTFSDTGDWLIDCLPLRDSNIIYKENTTWGQQFIGGVDIFRFGRLFSTFGALSKDCAVEFMMGRHLVLTQGDVVVHDGQQADSILNGKWRKWLTANINQDALDKCFVALNTAREEVWICLCIDDATYANVALIWNWRTGTIGRKTLPGVSIIKEGIVIPADADETWNSDTGTWDSDTTVWGERLYKTGELSMLMASADDARLYKADVGTDDAALPQVSFIERTGLGIPFKQNLPPDFTSYKFIRGMWPRIDGTLGGVVKIKIGVQNEINGAVQWGALQNFIIGTTTRVDVLMSGRLLAIHLESDTSVAWRWHGYELDVDFGGNY
jgi:hypothetical protein